jgi:hypothetical protein
LPGPPASGRHVGFRLTCRRRPQPLPATPGVMPVDSAVGEALRPHTRDGRPPFLGRGLLATCVWVPAPGLVPGGSGRERRGEAFRRAVCSEKVTGSARPQHPSRAAGRSTAPGTRASRHVARGGPPRRWGTAETVGKMSRLPSGTREIAWGEPPRGPNAFVSGRAAAGGRGRPAAFSRVPGRSAGALPCRSRARPPRS